MNSIIIEITAIYFTYKRFSNYGLKLVNEKNRMVIYDHPISSFPFAVFFLYTRLKYTSLIFAQYHGAPLEYMDVLADCNLVFTILFTIECVMKLTSFGPKVNTRTT